MSSKVAILTEVAHEATGQMVDVAYIDQGYTGESVREGAAQHGVDLMVFKLKQARRGPVLLPQRWMLERTFPWPGRWRRLSKDDEEVPPTEEAWTYFALSMLMLAQLAN